MIAFTLKTAQVEVRGQTITVSELTAGARAEMLDQARTSPLKAQILIVQHCVRNGDGRTAYGPGDFDKVAALPPDVIEKLSDKVLELSGMGGGPEVAPKG